MSYSHRTQVLLHFSVTAAILFCVYFKYKHTFRSQKDINFDNISQLCIKNVYTYSNRDNDVPF